VERPARVAPSTAADAPPWGLYIHLPFCPYKCHYCDFVAVPADGRLVARWLGRYLEALVREYALRRAEFGGEACTAYYGGGTPTLVPADDLAALHRRLGIPPERETTVEANPETLDPKSLSTLRAAGFNRLSLGLQAWQDEILERLGRRSSRADFLAAYHAARAAGFGNVNVDLMYGLPGQTPAHWRETLDAVLFLGPEHVSAYSLQIEPGTLFGARPPATPGEEVEAEMYESARERLAAAGYEQYEVSNWARPGFRCRHNLLYWRNQGWLGLGVGAASHRAGRRWTNTPRLAAYCAAVEADSVPPAVEETCDEPSDTLILGLRLVREGVRRSAFRDRFGEALDTRYGAAVRRLVGRGLLRDDGETLRLTDRGLLLGNHVFAEFVG
jgi:oxygen-independent coproporphyrinogen-3 oxidase